MRKFWNKHRQQLIGFVISGGLGACIDMGTLFIFHEWLHIPEEIAFLPSTLIACVFVFLFNRTITFKHSSHVSVAHQAWKFGLVYGFAIALNFALSNAFFAALRTMAQHWVPFLEPYAYLCAKALAIGIGAVLNYILSHTFIFRSKTEVPVV